MKIAIITFHDTFNYGASLQCAALSRYLKSIGNDVINIDYMPSYVRVKKSVFREFYNTKKRSGIKSKIKGIVRGVLYLSSFLCQIKRRIAYNKFNKELLNLTRRYKNYQELCGDPPAADLYICGSDQIWNPNLTGGSFDKAFFLDFIDKKKTAYGISVGELDIKKTATELKQLTNSFEFLSVRESSTAEQMKHYLNRDVEIVLDCTLLLDKDDYREMEDRSIKVSFPYLLIYSVSNTKVLFHAAKRIAKHLNLKIVDISPNPVDKHREIININDLGPSQFLSYIENADFVVTNSFHGTVFSILYQKQFVSIPHKTRPGRVNDLLKGLGLENRFYSEDSDSFDERIDYSTVMDRLNGLRQNSYDYLKKVIDYIPE